MSHILRPDWVNLLHGVILTIVLCFITFAIGLFIAAVHAVVRIFSRLRFLRLPFWIYVEFIRSTPLLVQLLLVFFGLPIIGLRIATMPAAILVLSLYSGAYLSAIVWAALDSVPRSQWEASLSMGLKRRHIFRYIAIPQATRVVLPGAVGFAVTLIKSSSLVSVIGLHDLTTVGHNVAQYTGQPLAVWGVVAIGYLVICTPLSAMGHRLEQKVRAR